MADIVVTATSVAPSTGALRLTKIASVAIAAGEAVYLVAATDQLALADNDLSSAAATGIGIALNSCAANQPCAYQYGGNITLGAVLTLGTTYILSSAAGGIAPIADQGSSDYVTILGVASSTSVLNLGINATGIQLA